MIRLLCLTIALCTTVAFAQTEKPSWRTPELANQVYMQTDEGLVIIELAPFAAPKHVERFVNLVKTGYYDGLDFYRVIDGFVAQGGDVSGEKTTEYQQPLKAEFTTPVSTDVPFLKVQQPDFMAPLTGFTQGFAVGRDEQQKQQWLAHCPGVIAMARSNEKDSATTDFYIVIGQATRHLDRNMSSFGRVIYGMPAVQSLKRAHINDASGVIEDENARSKIQWVKMAADVPKDERIAVQVQDEFSEQVEQRLSSAKTLDNPFFHFKGNGNLDICYYNLKSRVL